VKAHILVCKPNRVRMRIVLATICKRATTSTGGEAAGGSIYTNFCVLFALASPAARRKDFFKGNSSWWSWCVGCNPCTDSGGFDFGTAFHTCLPPVRRS